MQTTDSVLILGASYGSLLGLKLAMAGHDVTLVCLPATAEAINRDGICVRIPVKGCGSVAVWSRDLPGRITATGPATGPGGLDLSRFGLVALAMQEPQYGQPGVRDLLDAVARSGLPCMSIMNMPPLPYLHRIPGIDPAPLAAAYTDPAVWRNFDPAAMTLCSPDPQAFRPPGEPPNVLQVTLPTNFKVARFPSGPATAMLQLMQAGIEAARFGSAGTELPVKLKVHDSVFVPLAKWAMLVTGNYRCVTADGPRPIRDAVGADPAESRAVYQWVCDLCTTLGAAPGDMVPFEKYAAASDGLTRPSSAARALFAGTLHIERVDKLVQAIGVQQGMRNPVLDRTVALVDAQLAVNRKAAA